jgi:hypothetical protein
MTYLFKLARRAARLRAPLWLALAIAFAGCSGDSLTSPADTSPPADGAGVSAGPSFSTSYRGGIPFGNFAQPTSDFGDRYNGAMRNITPDKLLSELKAIKDRGGKVVLNLAGAPPRYIDNSGNFSLSMWKASVDRFKGVDFSSYIQDGTVVGNFLIDEPNDPANWDGKAVSESTVEEMAHYSKTRWPDMPTIARARPEYFTGTYQYLDAAWAQYLSRYGDPAKFLSENVAKAKNRGLALVVGFNILKGNDGYKLTASQIESWGSALLADSYPCAFISWKWDDAYMGRSDIGQALQYLSGKAANRSARTCRGGDAQQTTDSSTSPLPSYSGPLTLAVDAIWSSDGRDYVRLKWQGARTSTVDVYRNGVFRKNTENDGRQTFIRPLGGSSSYTYKLCEKGSTTCASVSATFK